MTAHSRPARAADSRPARPVMLGQNQYGKAENRVVKITRDGAKHHIKDLNVSVSLSGDLEEVHLSGSNAHCLPTDTTKNTVYAFAKEYGIESAEQFGIHLARHFVSSQEPIHRARIRIEEYAWERIMRLRRQLPLHRRRRGPALLRPQGPGDPADRDHLRR